MSGKPYTVSELKTIVNYLVENKLYSETRARKMWVDFANTKITNRTWQSLKETFIKRILPDIHNPYFKLTNEQISSFKARCDLAEKDKNKLEIHTISDDSSSNGQNPKDNEPSNDEGETNAGENTQCSKIPMRSRSSADTVILEHCYETVEDIQRDLESTEDKIEDLKQSEVQKSLRDCITYSEPLTPMLQEVLDDFASEPEDSDRENRMEIVENESVPEAENIEDIEIMNEQVPDFDNDNATTKSAEADSIEHDNVVEAIEELLDQEIDNESDPDNRPLNINSNNADESEPDLNDVVLDEEISSKQVETHTDKNIDDSSEPIDSVAVEKETVQPDTTNAGDTSSKNLQTEPQVQSGAINSSNSTVDATLPNNQEAINKKQSQIVEVNDKNTEESTNEVTNDTDDTQAAAKVARKRSVSEEPINYTHKKKKRLHIQLKSSSESEGIQKTESHHEGVIKLAAGQMGRSQSTDDYNKPSTSAVIDEVIEIEDVTTELPPVVTNPCLQTVSLFDEQFNKTRHNMSESSDFEKNKKAVEAEKTSSHKTVPRISKEASKSRSVSESEVTPPPPKKRKRIGVISNKSERDKAIAKMFGVTNGGGGHSKRKRRTSHRAERTRTTSHNNISHQDAARSDSSDWTSESESDAFVSPPRSRRNRSTKKYLKPRSVKIASLEEEGGLFIMYGRRIYPIVKDGKIIKNYVTFLPESDSDEELFWKQKYVEEKRKAAELKKLLQEAAEPKSGPIENIPAVHQPNPISTPRTSLVQVAEPSNCQAKEVPPSHIEEKKEKPPTGPEKIKIKFTKNNEEVHLEGHWPQIHPVLEQVVQIFHKESETAVNEPPQKPATNGVIKDINSGQSTPVVITVDPEVHEKVNKIEKEIFEEIKERDQEEGVKQNGVNNVTKRKQPVQRKSSSSSIPTPEKRPKMSNGTVETNKQTNETVAVENGRPRRLRVRETENKSVDNQEMSPKRQSKTPRKVLNETVNTTNLKTMQTRRSKQNLENSPKEQEEEVKYMLATRSKRLSLKANNKTNKKTYKR